MHFIMYALVHDSSMDLHILISASNYESLLYVIVSFPPLTPWYIHTQRKTITEAIYYSSAL